MAVKTIASAGVSIPTSGLSSLSVGQHANTGVTAEDAPVLLSVQADQVIDASTFAKLVAEANTDLSAAFVVRMLNLMNEVVADCIATATAAPSIDLGWGKFLFEIAGSLDTATGTPGADNYCYFSGTVNSEYQRKFALMDAYAATGENPCDLKRIRDKATAVLNVIDGTNTFFIDGRGLSAGGTGESCALYDALGVTKKCDITIVSAQSYETSLQANLPSNVAIPVGDYLVKLVCVKDGTPYTMTKDVKVISAVTPPTTTITQVTDGDGVAGQAKKDKGITIDGTLFPTSDAELKVESNKLFTLAEDGSQISSVGFDTLKNDGAFVTNSATQIKFNELIWTPLTCTGASKFEVTINGATKLVALVTA